MKTATLAGGASPFAHLLGGMFGRKPTAAKADDDGIAPADEGEIDQSEVDDAIDDAGVEDVEDEGDGTGKGKKAKGKKAKAEDEPDDDEDDETDPKAEEPEDEKEAKAFRRGLTVGAKRENARCKAIFSTKAAGVRPDVAAQLAFGTRQSAAEALGVLNAAAAPAAGRATLDSRMAGRADPKPGADAGGSGAKPNLANRIAAAKKKAGMA